MKKGKTKMYIWIIISIFILIIVLLLLDPLRKQSENIREDVLKITPIGMSMEGVIEIIENRRRWEVRFICEERGYSLFRGRPLRAIDPNAEIIGEKHIEGHLGWYRGVWRVDVTAFWAFDENGKLIDVAILKEGDAL